jgi:hypothetical protein
VAPSTAEITNLLATIRMGGPGTEAKFVVLVHDEFRALTRRHMRRERPDHTLQPTALEDEAYPKRDWSAARAWLQAQLRGEPA